MLTVVLLMHSLSKVILDGETCCQKWSYTRRAIQNWQLWTKITNFPEEIEDFWQL